MDAHGGTSVFSPGGSRTSLSKKQPFWFEGVQFTSTINVPELVYSKETQSSPLKCKIMATIGPKTANKCMIGALVEAGMSLMRLNMAYGNHQERAELASMLRAYLAAHKKQCAILMDLRGPGIRVGHVKDDQAIQLRAGQMFNLYCDQDCSGDAAGIAVDYPRLDEVLAPGHMVAIDYGKILLTVVSCEPGTVVCKVNHSTVLLGNKPLSLIDPTSHRLIPLPDVSSLSIQDVRDIRFGLDINVDFMALSHVQCADDLLAVRELLGIRGQGVKLVAKIQTQSALEQFDSILQASDAIMVSRGDLGVELPIEQVCIVQKMIIRKCNAAGKPVITANQMLESMMEKPRPTRAEATDVANAVFDGSDCLMLAGETARGLYPIESVLTMARICKEAEATLDYKALFTSIQSIVPQPLSVVEAIASSAVKCVFDLKAKMIIAMSATGATARLIAKYRPNVPILCITSSEQTTRQVLLCRGLIPFLVGSMLGTDSLVARALTSAKNKQLVHHGDLVVVTSGMREGMAGASNVIKVVLVD